MKSLIFAAVMVAVGGSSAMAQETGHAGWFVRTGPLGVVFDEHASISVGGVGMTGASTEAQDNATLGFDIGYRFNEHFSATLSGGIPPKTKLYGTGPLQGVFLGSTYYAPAVMAVQYHLPDFGLGVRPYLGGGLNYTLFFGEKDGAVSNLKIKNKFAPVLQVGAELDINDKWGLYFDAKKIWLSSTATGTVGGAPARAEITANPYVISGGLTYKF